MCVMYVVYQKMTGGEDNVLGLVSRSSARLGTLI